MTAWRSNRLWGATFALWLASLLTGPALLSLPWALINMPGVFADRAFAPLMFGGYAVAFGWLAALVFVGVRHSRTMRWVHFAVPVALTILFIFLATVSSNAGAEVSLISH